ncbi:MAG: ankyrin repeat domain-containing protein [Micavibrio sp.]|nr:ankyrin repeat domain-containing protein [Micavibrio sp.]
MADHLRDDFNSGRPEGIPAGVPFAKTPSAREISEFCDAAKYDERDTVRRLLDEYGINIINRRDSIDARALTWAAWAGHLDMVELLLERGAALDAPGTYDRTALGWAADMGRADIARLLLVRGANTNAVDDNGFKPADLARNSNQHDLALEIETAAEQRRQAEVQRKANEALKAEEAQRNAAAGNLEAIKKARRPGGWKIPPQNKP